jgi:hypothetical protein
MYLPKHQFTQVSVADLLEGAAEGVLADALGNLLNKSEITLTSEGEFYDVPPKDLEKGIFTNATQYFLPEGESAEIANAFVEPTDLDRENCSFERYFTKNTSTGKIKELRKVDYQSAKLNPKNYELFAKTDWNLCGPLSDQEINGYFLEGTASKNKKLVDELEKKIPGIKDILTDYSQFVDDKTPPAPAPKAPTKITVPAPSK